MENMEGLGTFFLIIIPVSILFILLTTRAARNPVNEPEAVDKDDAP